MADGKLRGEAAGEKSAVDQYENKTLQAVTLDGPFAGTFGHQIPQYPGVRPPTSSNSCSWYRPVVHRACLDGLEYGYYRAAKAIYLREIGGLYNGAYNQAYSRAYQKALSAYYQQSYLKGKNRWEK